jgi:hypothetical protein
MVLIGSFDFSDVDGFLKGEEDAVVAKEKEIGEEAVRYAVEHGSYRNRTGLLRKSNEFVASKEGVTLYNGATAPDGYQYASYVESRGYDVLTGAALYTEKRCKEEFEE